MSATQAPVAIIMGSRSDWPILRHAAEMLDSLGVAYEAKVVSAVKAGQWKVNFSIDQISEANGERLESALFDAVLARFR